MNREDIIYDYVALEEEIRNLNAIKTSVEDLMKRLDSTVSRLNEGFISRSQKAFQQVHAEKKSEYDLLNQLLTEMPVAIKKSMDDNDSEDSRIAEDILRRFGL